MANLTKPTQLGLVAFSAALAVAPSAWAEDPWAQLNLAPAPVEIEPAGEQRPVQLDLPEPDWTLLDTNSPSSVKAALHEQKVPLPSNAASWSSQNNANGSAALSVKQALSPFWDTHVGADLNVARQPAPRSTSELFREQFGTENAPSPSSGAAWASMTAPGVASIWDKTAIEARVDSGSDQSKLGTSLSKAVPLAGNQYSLTLQNGYNVIQQNGLPMVGYNGRPVRSYETDQQARLSIADTGTSIVAGQTLSTSDDRWLRKVGAEQTLFGGVNISASVSETLQGPANKSLTAGFRHSW